MSKTKAGWLWIISAVTLLSSGLCIAEEQELADLRKRKHCNILVMANLNQFQWIYSNWFDPKNKRTNIAGNFRALQKKNSKRYQQLLELVDTHADLPNDVVQLREVIREVDDEQSDLLSGLTDIAVKNDYFEDYLYAIEESVIDLKEETEQLSQYCDSYREETKKGAKTLDGWKKAINFYRSYIAQQQVKFERMYMRALDAVRLRAYRAYFQVAINESASTYANLEQALELDRYYTYFLKWWHRIGTLSELGNGLHTRYLQYKEPLRVLESQLLTAQEHHTRVSSIIRNPTRDRVLSEIQGAITHIQGAIDSLKKTGQQGQLANQVMFSERRLSDPAFSETCKRKVREHLAAAKAAVASDRYEYVNHLYFHTVHLCKGRL